MQIRLTPANVNTAITNHLKTLGVDVNSQQVSFTYSNKRKSGGVFVDVVIGDANTPVETPPAQSIEAPAPEAETPVEEAPTPATVPVSLFN
jgi:hypothetical protein